MVSARFVTEIEVSDQGNIAPHDKDLDFLDRPLASLGLVLLVFGLPVLIGCAALALISFR